MECPICLEEKKINIICGNKHYVCNDCKKRIDKCPMCRLPLFTQVDIDVRTNIKYNFKMIKSSNFIKQKISSNSIFYKFTKDLCVRLEKIDNIQYFNDKFYFKAINRNYKFFMLLYFHLHDMVNSIFNFKFYGISKFMFCNDIICDYSIPNVEQKNIIIKFVGIKFYKKCSYPVFRFVKAD